MTDFYCKLADTEVGPFSGIELREAALAGIVRKDTFVSADPSSGWLPASSARNLFDADGRVRPVKTAYSPKPAQALAIGFLK